MDISIAVNYAKDIVIVLVYANIIRLIAKIQLVKNMSEKPKFAVFGIEQLKAAALEIAMRVHDYDESLYIIDEEEIYKILCRWTKDVPPEQPVWDSTQGKLVSLNSGSSTQK